MAGQKNRPRKMLETSRAWNIVFPVRLIEEIKTKANARNITAASLVRETLDNPIEPNPGVIKEKIFYIIRKEFVYPRYASGKTLGDVLIDKIEKNL